MITETRPPSTLPRLGVAAIPAELKGLPRWVTWRYEFRGRRWTKVPYSPGSGAAAKPNEPTTCGSFEDALAAARARGHDGIGFVFAKDDPYCGVDLDDCLDDRGRPVPEARAILERLGSYAEVSPSGRGVKVWVKGKLPIEGSGRRTGARGFAEIEMYQHSRYFTVTGWVLEGSAASIAEAAGLGDIYTQYFGTNGDPRPRAGGGAGFRGTDDDLIAKAKAAANGARFARLWAGDVSEYGSHSEADLALCSMLAFWTGGDPGHVDRLFRLSGLCRPKWTEREAYRQQTIEKAITGHTSGGGARDGRRAGTVRGPRAAGDGQAPAAIDTEGLTKALADAILEGHRYAQDAGGRLYVFRGGVYRPDGDEHVRRLVKTVLHGWKRSRSWSSRRAGEVIEYLRLDAPHLWDRPPADRINLPNGLLDVRRRVLLPHDPEFLSPVQLAARYDPGATCPAWDAFAGEVFPADAVALAFEIPACLMVPGLLQKRAVLLVGEGDNGKSVYLVAVVSFLGRRNVAAVTLHKLEGDRFALARLVGRLANISPDLPSDHLKGTSVFKAITRGDEMEAERKFHDAFGFEPFARLVFSANHLPRSADASDAFYRRWTVVPFVRRFEPREQVPRDVLDARLASPAELSGVLNRALEALPGLGARGYTQAESTTAAWAEFRSVTDPVAVWLERHAVAAPAAMVGKDALFSAYQRHASGAGHPAITKNAFGRQVREAFPAIDDKQRTLDGKLVWCWIGLGLAAEEGRP